MTHNDLTKLVTRIVTEGVQADNVTRSLLWILCLRTAKAVAKEYEDDRRKKNAKVPSRSAKRDVSSNHN